MSALYPGAVANIVHVELTDGRELTKRVDYPSGPREKPAEGFGSGRKFHFLVAPALGEVAAKRILDHAWKLDEATGVTELMHLVEMPA